MTIRRSNILSAALVVLALNGTAHADEQKDMDQLHTLFSKMVGDWQCEGAFSNGKPLAANINFKTDFDGQILLYRHEDLPPNSFKARGHWSFSVADNNLVATSHMAGSKGSTIATYIGDGWTDIKLTFNAKELWAPLWAENRFIWEVPEPGKLTMVWELFKDNEWHMGDYLNCHK